MQFGICYISNVKMRTETTEMPVPGNTFLVYVLDMIQSAALIVVCNSVPLE